MIRVKSTYTPKEIKTKPDSNISMQDILTYWSQENCNLNETLYLSVVRAKIFTK
jgi:hypothetical protein